MTRDVFDLRADARELDLANRVMVPEVPRPLTRIERSGLAAQAATEEWYAQRPNRKDGER